MCWVIHWKSLLVGLEMHLDNEVEDQRFTGGFGVGVSVAKLLATSGRRLHLEVFSRLVICL